MGWIKHNGIVVTSWNAELLARAHEVAKQTLPGVSAIVQGVVNSFGTFLVGPDGSKEGWADSDLGDARRNAFINWLEAQAYDDGSNSLAWLEYEHDVDNRIASIPRYQGMIEAQCEHPEAAARGDPGDLEIYCNHCGEVLRKATQ